MSSSGSQSPPEDDSKGGAAELKGLDFSVTEQQEIDDIIDMANELDMTTPRDIPDEDIQQLLAGLDSQSPGKGAPSAAQYKKTRDNLALKLSFSRPPSVCAGATPVFRSNTEGMHRGYSTGNLGRIAPSSPVRSPHLRHVRDEAEPQRINSRTERSSSLPGGNYSAERMEELIGILEDEHKLTKFKRGLSHPRREAVEFLCELRRFLGYVESLDPVVVNNMTQKLCSTYADKEALPDNLRRFMTERMEGNFGDLKANIQFISDCHDEMFDLVLCQILPPPPPPKHSFPPPSDVIMRGSGNQKREESPVVEVSEETSGDDPTIRRMKTSAGEMIVAATIPRIVSLMTGDVIDHELLYTCVLTMGYYLGDRGKLLALLQNHLQEVVDEYENRKDPTVVRCALRTVNLLKLWVEIHLEDFTQVKSSVNQLVRSFANEQVQPIMPSAASNLINYMDTKCAAVVLGQKEEQFQFSEKPPKSKKGPTSMRSVKSAADIRVLDHVHPLEMARQLALVDHELYRSIQPNELLHMNWTKNATKKQKSPNVLNMIGQFNQLGQWVVSAVITTYDPTERSRLLQFIIRVAYESYKLNNLNSAMAIVSGLRNSNVIRLKSTWNALPSESWDMWEEVTEKFVLNDNFASLRAIAKSTQPPLIPYLGVYLSDLTFTEGHPNFLDDGLVNLSKMRSIAQILQQMKEGQTTPYCLTPVPLIQQFVTSLPSIPEEEYPEHRKRCDDGNGADASQMGGKSRASMQISSTNHLDPAKKPRRNTSFFSLLTASK